MRYALGNLMPTWVPNKHNEPPRGRLELLRQSTWWAPAQPGSWRFLAELEPRHRANIAGFCIDRAAQWYSEWLARYEYALMFGSLSVTDYAPTIPDEAFDELERGLGGIDGYVRRTVRAAIDRGYHLDSVRASMLFNKLMSDPEVVALVRPGVGEPLAVEHHINWTRSVVLP